MCDFVLISRILFALICWLYARIRLIPPLPLRRSPARPSASGKSYCARCANICHSSKRFNFLNWSFFVECSGGCCRFCCPLFGSRLVWCATIRVPLNETFIITFSLALGLNEELQLYKFIRHIHLWNHRPCTSRNRSTSSQPAGAGCFSPFCVTRAAHTHTHHTHATLSTRSECRDGCLSSCSPGSLCGCTTKSVVASILIVDSTAYSGRATNLRILHHECAAAMQLIIYNLSVMNRGRPEQENIRRHYWFPCQP